MGIQLKTALTCFPDPYPAPHPPYPTEGSGVREPEDGTEVNTHWILGTCVQKSNISTALSKA